MILLRLFCILFIFISLYTVCYLIEIYDLRRRIIRYNKRHNGKLDSSFKELNRLNRQYKEWYIYLFVPDSDSGLSLYERINK